MAASVVAVERCCSADRRQCHHRGPPPHGGRSLPYGRSAELAHRAGRPRSRSAKRAKPSTPSPQLSNPGAVEHHGLARAASSAAPRAHERRSKQVSQVHFRRSISAVAGTIDSAPARNPAPAAAIIPGPPRCRRMAASVVGRTLLQCRSSPVPHRGRAAASVRVADSIPRSATTRRPLAHRAGRPGSRSAKRAKP